MYINNDNCYARVLTKSNGKGYFYDINTIKDEEICFDVINNLNKKDLFFSLNTFRNCKSSTRKNLFCINCIAVDVDYKKVKELNLLLPEQIIHLLELDFFDKTIPTPNLIEYGNQVRLIYRLNETVYIPKNRDNAITLARRISEVFADNLKDYGAERQNIESYFRFPSSINTKNNCEIKIFKYNDSITYSMRELQELWLDELPKWHKRKVGRRKTPKKVIKLHNVYSLNTNRLIDFEILQEYLNNNYITDLRSRLCFLYRNYWLIRLKYQNGILVSENYEEAKVKMLEYNSNFKYPLRMNVIESATRCVNHTQYLYKNETVVRFLELNFDFCSKIGLHSMYKPKDKKDINFDYYKRNSNNLNKKNKKHYYDSNYYTNNKEKFKEKNKKNYEKNLVNSKKLSKKEKIELEVEKIKELMTRGYTKKQVSEELNISIETVKRRYRIIKK